MVMLLIVFHCGVSFMNSSLDSEIWTYKNESTSVFFDALIGFIHTFRHPTFFIISGFVSEMMYSKYTSNTVLKKRFERIFIPFVITVLSLSHLVHLLLNKIEFGAYNINHQLFIDSTYVWFLYYLTIYSVIHFIYKKWIKNRISFKNTIHNVITLSIIIYITTSITLYFWGENTLFGTYDFIPDFGSVMGYTFFYFLGVIFFKHQSLFYQLKKYGWLFIALGFLALNIYFYLSALKLNCNDDTFNFDWGLMLFYNFTSTYISLGAIGLALKFYTRPISLITYLSKSSYFLYLIHFPFVLLSLILISDKNWSVFVKFLVVLSLTLSISFFINFIWRKLWNNNPPI